MRAKWSLRSADRGEVPNSTGPVFPRLRCFQSGGASEIGQRRFSCPPAYLGFAPVHLRPMGEGIKEPVALLLGDLPAKSGQSDTLPPPRLSVGTQDLGHPLWLGFDQAQIGPDSDRREGPPDLVLADVGQGDRISFSKRRLREAKAPPEFA